MKIIEPYTEILTPFTRESILPTLRLIEAAARTCYKSEDAITEDSAGPFVQKIACVYKHECYDELTEVLAAAGWKRWADVTLDDELATLHPTTHVIAYQRPSHITDVHYEGDMYRVSSKVDLLVTPQHRMFVCETSTKRGRKKRDFKFITARDLDDKSHCYTRVGRWELANTTLSVSDAELELLGFAIGDGWLVGNKVTFRLRKRRKISYLGNLASRIGAYFGQLENDIYTVDVSGTLRDLLCGMRDDQKRKKIPDGLITSISARDANSLLRGLINSDGHVGKTGVSYYTTSENLAGQVQQLCLHAGSAATVMRQDIAESAGAYGGDYTMWKVHILTKELRPGVNKVRLIKPQTSWEFYKGRVYCATVPHGTLYVRRNGRAVWCGNSVIEHSSITVRFVVDRGVSHELVRHRLAAYSQESTRYANYAKGKFDSEITVIRPSFFAEGSETYRLWYNSCTTAEQAYLELIARGRKPQEARSVLPSSLKTEVVMTANLREWRHVFRLRCAPNAHPQMREVMVPLANQFAEVLPELFVTVAE